MRAEATNPFLSKLEETGARSSVPHEWDPQAAVTHLVQTMVPEVAHGLLDALRQGLSGALHVHSQRDPKHTPVLVVWNLDPFHELGHSPV